jgi:release factor glutamine methyltransferase
MPEKTWKIGEIIRQAKRYLANHAAASPRLDAEILLCHILGQNRLYLYVHFDQPLETREVGLYRKLLRRRAGGEPVAYITGRKPFLRLELTVSPAVLIPRPETEFLAQEGINLCAATWDRFLEVGAGSGAVTLSILSACPRIRAVAVDISSDALKICRANAERYSLSGRLRLVRADIRDFIRESSETFPLIISNPPYIPRGELVFLPREVRREPRAALDGGPDGLDFYRLLLRDGQKLLSPGGIVLLELGCGQTAAVREIGEAAGLSPGCVLTDYAGLARVISFSAR